jgi:CubicO group peptidase (beta-lactamase class C family)
MISRRQRRILSDVIKALGIALFGTLVTTAVGCHSSPSSNSNPTSSQFTYRDPYAWPTSSPAAQGMDTAQVSAGLREIKNNAFIFSLLVIRNDLLVIEYYSRFQKENDFEIHSAAKSFTSALIGIAIDQGLIRSVQEKVLGYFPQLDTAGIDPRKRNWTLEHFLTMRSGIDWDESADHTALFTDNVNWLYTTLRLPLKYSPGESFVYTTPNVNVLSGIITRTTGMSTYEFAEKNLFTPLKISVRSWLTDPQGVYIGGTGMMYTPRDLARFGQLYLHNGLIDGKQIISKQWIQQTLLPRNPTNSTWGDLSSVNYGYLWWNNYSAQDSIFMAAGFAGQFIFIVPAKNMVIVTIGDDNPSEAQASLNETVVIGILKKYFF